MSTFNLLGKEVSFDESFDRYLSIRRECQDEKNRVKKEFIEFYDNSSGIESVLGKYPHFLEKATTSTIENLFQHLIDMEIYDVDKEDFEDTCWDLSAAEEEYEKVAESLSEIDEELNNIKQYRAMRKATRSRYGWVSSNNLSSMASASMSAGAMNLASGLGHSIFNFFGNAISTSKANSQKRELYNNPRTKALLLSGATQCVISMFDSYIQFVNGYPERSEPYYSDSTDYKKSHAIINNISRVDGQDKKDDLLFKAFAQCPFNTEVLSYAFENYPDERDNIYEIGRSSYVDMESLMEERFGAMYNDEVSKSPERTLEVREQIIETMEKYGIEESETLYKIEVDRIMHICEQYVESIPFENKELIDLLRETKIPESEKKRLVQYGYIWELAKEYDVEYEYSEKEKIIKNIYDTLIDTESLETNIVLERLLSA
ncbi:MAG: hypothetical protein IK071_04210, partial [Lachnospiraceae bacterium]|nr:hypothetical protein [Lachnospiraceae bacterium]